MHKELFEILAPLELPILAMAIFALTFVAVLLRLVVRGTPVDETAALPLFDDDGLSPAPVLSAEVSHGR